MSITDVAAPADDTLHPDLILKLERAQAASRRLATATTDRKNEGLQAMADAMRTHSQKIIEANKRDLDRGRDAGLSTGLLDRLRLDETRLDGLAVATELIATLDDPVGETLRGKTLPNGLQLTQVRVPFGVIGAIYEARPNVTADIGALALKSGNAAVLRGGTAAELTNKVLIDVLQNALTSVDLPGDSIQTIDEFGRQGATDLMRARGLIDVLIPRGSAQLINTVVRESKVPVIETGAGVVHVFLDESADAAWAVDIVHNAKTQRPSVCNALETLLVHEKAAERLLPSVLADLHEAGVTIHADERVRVFSAEAVPATDEDWATEHMSLDISVKVVQDLDEALEHIRRYSTHNTESIITNDLRQADRFLAEVDSAVVMVNASTRFTDGGEFGFGAEVGISTQKLHARGPMGLPELTSSKWIVRGAGHVRG